VNQENRQPERSPGGVPRRPGDTPEWGPVRVSVRYGPVLALDQVTARVTPGEISAVVGGDGAGKTTLLRCVAGVLAPDEGEVRGPAARDIGYLPPGGGIYPDLTVDENLSFRAAAFGLSPAQARQRVAGYLDRTGLAGVRGRLAGNLSGGMRHKLGVIAALLPGPALLVLDEPTTGVDPVSRADLWWLIAGAAAGGAAVLLSTTYLDEAQRAARVLLLDAGRELASGTPAQIVAGMPGDIRPLSARPGEDGPRRRAWRRGGQWRIWDPPGAGRPDGGPEEAAEDGIRPDLQDAAVVAALARELAGAAALGAPGTPGASR